MLKSCFSGLGNEKKTVQGYEAQGKTFRQRVQFSGFFCIGVEVLASFVRGYNIVNLEKKYVIFI